MHQFQQASADLSTLTDSVISLTNWWSGVEMVLASVVARSDPLKMLSRGVDVIGLQAGAQSVLSAQLATGSRPTVLPLDYYHICAMRSRSPLVTYLFIFDMFSAPRCGLLTYSLYLEISAPSDVVTYPCGD